MAALLLLLLEALQSCWLQRSSSLAWPGAACGAAVALELELHLALHLALELHLALAGTGAAAQSQLWQAPLCRQQAMGCCAAPSAPTAAAACPCTATPCPGLTRLAWAPLACQCCAEEGWQQAAP